MPLDNVIYRTTPEVLETGFAGLRQLATELDNQLPWNFTWRFNVPYVESECGYRGCACGLAKVLWPEQVEHPSPGSMIGVLRLGLSEDATSELWDIFGFNSLLRYGSHTNEVKDYDKVTPQMVAKELNRFCDEYA